MKPIISRNSLMSILIVELALCFLTGCVAFAPPSPMITFGGPQTTDKGTSETALGLGSGAALFQGAHAVGQGWFGRYKFGLSDRWDIGIDVIGFSHSDKYCTTAKAAARYRLNPHFRLEGGLGAADDSFGKSINGDIGLTWGTLNELKPWNLYSTFRVGYAYGFPGDTTAPPNTSIVLVNVGTQGKISDKMNFIFEGGYGYLFPKGKDTGTIICIACGIMFKIGTK